MNKVTLPELEHHCGSWIYVTKSGDVRETFSKRHAQIALNSGCRVYTAAQWLDHINNQNITRALAANAAA